MRGELRSVCANVIMKVDNKEKRHHSKHGGGYVALAVLLVILVNE